MKAEKIIKILIEEKNYDKVQTERLAPKIEALPTDIKDALVKWVESGDVSSPEYNGYYSIVSIFWSTATFAVV